MCYCFKLSTVQLPGRCVESLTSNLSNRLTLILLVCSGELTWSVKNDLLFCLHHLACTVTFDWKLMLRLSYRIRVVNQTMLICMCLKHGTMCTVYSAMRVLVKRLVKRRLPRLLLLGDVKLGLYMLGARTRRGLSGYPVACIVQTTRGLTVT